MLMSANVLNAQGTLYIESTTQNICIIHFWLFLPDGVPNIVLDGVPDPASPFPDRVHYF